MTSVWLAEIGRIIQTALLDPESKVEMAFMLVTGFIAFVGVMSKAGDALKITVPESNRSIAVFFITAAAILLAVGACNIWLVPRMENPDISKWLPAVTVVVVLLVVSVPAMCLIQRANYLQGLFSLLMSVVAAALVVLLVHTLFDAVRHKKKEFGRTKSRKDTITDVIAK